MKRFKESNLKMGQPIEEAGPLTVTYNIQMLSFGWTIPISKIQNRNENLSNYKELVKKFKRNTNCRKTTTEIKKH